MIILKFWLKLIIFVLQFDLVSVGAMGSKKTPSDFLKLVIGTYVLCVMVWQILFCILHTQFDFVNLCRLRLQAALSWSSSIRACLIVVGAFTLRACVDALASIHFACFLQGFWPVLMVHSAVGAVGS